MKTYDDGMTVVPILNLNFNHFGNSLEGNNLMAKYGINSKEYREAEASWKAKQRAYAAEKATPQTKALIVPMKGD